MTTSGWTLTSSGSRAAPERQGVAGWWTERTRSLVGILGFALLVWVPLLLTDPGKVVADTKSYPYLDPHRFIGRISSLWDPNIGLGTVTHQNVGYLFPLGPFYWLTHGVLGMPAWVAQRLWLGTLLFAAGMGMRYLLRTLGVRGPGVPVAMLAYALTPYATEFSARLSVLLGPWAALGFLIGFAVRALREPRNWKYPALFALTVQLVGGVNATALLYALIGPALWVPYVIWVRGEVTPRQAWSAIWRAGLLTFVTSLWWAVGLLIEGSYGMGILRFTESVSVVSHTSTATEILRGLGYWFFYGSDLRGPWNDGVLDFTRRTWLVLVSFLIPALAMLAAGLVRWKHRAYFVMLIFVGVVIAVAASPYEHPSTLGAVFKAFATSSTAGFALRSTARAVPLVVMGLAALLGCGVSALADRLGARRGWIAVTVAAVIGALCVANAPGLWAGRYYSAYLERDEQIPAYWRQALAALDARGDSTRVLALPGADFAAYRWGDTIDPIEPGLMDRPYVARELVPWGGEATTNLLIALDRRIQDRLLDPNALAPVARLMGVGDVLLRLDLATDQFSLVSARALWSDFTEDGVPKGLDPPVTYGTKAPGTLIGQDVGDPAEPPEAEPAPVAVFRVVDPTPIVRARSAADPLVIDGDGEGIVDAAGVGLLPSDRLVVQSPQYNGSKSALREHVPAGAVLLVTDTNRRQGMRWAGMRNNYGYTEQAGEQPLQEDLLDQRLDVYPDVSDRARTVSELRGGIASVRATTYGTPAFGFTPAARPTNAFDGDARSAWEVASGETKVGEERIVATLADPVTTDHLVVEPASRGPRGRWITKVGVRLDDGRQHVYPIPRRGRDTLRFPRQQFSKVELQILGTDANRVGKVASEAGRRRKSSVGFSEIEIRDDTPGARILHAKEITRLPLDLLDSLGARSATHPLGLLMTSPADSGTWRRFVLPTARSFSVSATGHLNASAKDDAIDLALGIPGVDQGGIQARSSERLGNVKARASNAFDGDPATAWNSRSFDIPGEWLQVSTPQPVTFDRLDLALLDDGRHSVPTRLRISTEDGATRVVDVPATAPLNGVGHATVRFDPMTGRTVRITVDAIRPVTIRGSNRAPIVLPVGIAEAGIPGVQRAPMPAQLPAGCLNRVVTVDGAAVPVKVTGSTADAIEGRPLEITACAGPLTLAAGSHELRSRAPRTSGLSINQFLLLSDRTGAAADPAAFKAALAAPSPEGSRPALTVTDRRRASSTVRYRDAKRPFWLVLGESNNRGWRATIDGKDLGPPQLVDGFANGWRIDPARFGPANTVALTWTPQRGVWVALALSAAGVLACLGILVAVRIRRRRRGEAGVATPPVDAPAVLASPFTGSGGAAPWGTTAVVATGVLLVTAAIVGAPWAVVAALAAGGALRSARLRGVVRLLPAVIVGLIALYVWWGQVRHNYAAQFEWPLNFERARNAAWLAVVLLVVDVVVGRVRSRRGTGTGVTPPA